MIYTFCTVELLIFVHALVFLQKTFCDLSVSEPSPLSVSAIVCEDPTPPSRVTVVQPHNNTVSSVIVFQCRQSGFTPSPPSSVCGEDERWSPDPSQVVCVTSTGMLMRIIIHSTIVYYSRTKVLTLYRQWNWGGGGTGNTCPVYCGWHMIQTFVIGQSIKSQI